jgi:hypothetical protein
MAVDMGKAIGTAARSGRLLLPLLVSLVACGETAKHPATSAAGYSGDDTEGFTNGGASDAGGTSTTAGTNTETGGQPSAGAGGASLDECPSADIDLDTDPDHCGSCDNACGPRNACVGGTCTPDLLTVAEIPNCGTLALQINPGNYAPQIIYALATKSGILYKLEVPNVGDATIAALSPGLTGSSSFDLSWDVLVTAGNSVIRVDPLTGEKIVVATDTTPISDTTINAGEGSVLYATNTGIKLVELGASGAGTLLVASEDGAEPRALASWLNMLFYTTSGTNNVQAVNLPSTAPVVIATAQKGLLFGHNSLQSDGTNLYWVNGSLQMAPLENELHPVSTIAHAIDNSPIIAYAVDSVVPGIAYIATQDGSFEKAHFDSKDAAVWIARALPHVTSVVMNDTNVYLASACTILQKPRLVFDETGTGVE